MTIEKVDDYLDEQYGISYTELVKQFGEACKIINGRFYKIKQQEIEIKHLNDLLDSALKELDDLKK